MDCYISKLSNDIVESIFFKLPTAALSQCRAVCKSWRNIISDPDFIKLHSSSCFSLLLLMETVTKGLTIRTSTDEIFQQTKKMELFCLEFLAGSCHLGSLPWLGPLLFVNSCNGLLCLRQQFPGILIINPSKGECVTLPCRNRWCWDLTDGVLGFCLKSKRYKAIEISCRFGKSGRYWEAYVYTLGTADFWRSIGAAPSYEGIYRRDFSKVFANGYLYWLDNSRERFGEVLSFDFEREKFGSLSLPCVDIWEGIGDFGDSIYACKYGKYDDDYVLEIWLMKEYGVKESWAKLLVLKYHRDCGSFFHLEVIKALENGDLLLYNGFDFVLYNRGNNKYTRLDIPQEVQLHFDGKRLDLIVPNNPNVASLKDVVVGDNLKFFKLKYKTMI
ncbi:hypothetical protein P3X46_017480 [Hevea brasiliensis]|uniref:Uncharacterized protein n=2 Tax=Hevea brasiliensis TaxID=3981 RepID=A0A6A6K374_HEVBR|nr:F-box protein At3g07870-like [Hevea brasiliensis]KAF2283097.1 hypothetical protein GH714_043420 [Hevea brasiliensis]KAJ9169273.1 hypothetical protein P3X46_017480 [Hevea brasiliensis]